MVPNMAAVHAATIAAAHRRHERERQEEERRLQESKICRKTIPCKYCMDYLNPDNCTKEKVNL